MNDSFIHSFIHSFIQSINQSINQSADKTYAVNNSKCRNTMVL